MDQATMGVYFSIFSFSLFTQGSELHQRWLAGPSARLAAGYITILSLIDIIFYFFPYINSREQDRAVLFLYEYFLCRSALACQL